MKQSCLKQNLFHILKYFTLARVENFKLKCFKRPRKDVTNVEVKNLLCSGIL